MKLGMFASAFCDVSGKVNALRMQAWALVVDKYSCFLIRYANHLV